MTVRRRCASILAAGFVLAAAATPGVAYAGAVPAERCPRVTIAVEVKGADYEIAGSLCGVRDGDPDQVLQVMVPGYTYTSAYWDFPYHPEQYSYALEATEAGYATLAIDRIGTGASSKPPVTAVTTDSNVDTLHQVIQAVRSGGVGPGFDTVVLVGHSLGSFLSILEIAKYGDVDGYIQTGYLDTVGPFLPAIAALIPAQLDPVTAATGPPLGYQTTLAGTRRALFYHPATTDPAVVATDERLKSTAGLELPTAIVPLGGQLHGNVLEKLRVRSVAASADVRIPVMVAMGSEDRLFCGLLTDCRSHAAVRRSVEASFPNATTREVFILPGAGHDSALATNGGDMFVAMTSWMDRHFGTSSPAAPTRSPEREAKK